MSCERCKGTGWVPDREGLKRYPGAKLKILCPDCVTGAAPTPPPPAEAGPALCSYPKDDQDECCPKHGRSVRELVAERDSLCNTLLDTVAERDAALADLGAAWHEAGGAYGNPDLRSLEDSLADVIRHTKARADTAEADLAAAQELTVNEHKRAVQLRERVKAANAENDGLLAELRATQEQLAQREDGGRVAECMERWRALPESVRNKVINTLGDVGIWDDNEVIVGGEIVIDCLEHLATHPTPEPQPSTSRCPTCGGIHVGTVDCHDWQHRNELEPAVVVAASEGDAGHLRKTVAEWGGDFDDDPNSDDFVLGALSRATILSPSECIHGEGSAAVRELREAAKRGHVWRTDGDELRSLGECYDLLGKALAALADDAGEGS